MSDLHTALEAAITTVNQLRADVARLEAERDEALRLERQAAHELGLTVAERDEARATQLRYLRELTATCSCGTSPMTYEGPEPDCAVHGAVRAFNEAAAELARMRPVYDAVVQLHRTYVLCGGRRMEPGDAWRMLNDFIDETPLAAVDQTTPSSPLETPHTADDGEAGVVEGARGSEAAEGEQVAAWELQAINDEYARRMAAAPRRPEGRTPLSRERAAELVGSNTRVRVWLNYAGPGDEGVVIGYLDRPSVIIQRPDGSQSSWSIDLDYEELGTDG